MIYMTMPKHMNPCPWIHEIYILSRLFNGHLYNILSLSKLCLGLEKIFKRNIEFSINNFYGHAPEPLPRGS